MGEGRSLSPVEEATVQQLIQAHFPDELNIDSALWTRSAVQTIACKCGIEMPMRTVGEYLKRWGYTPQKPLKRAYEQDPQAVKVWWETHAKETAVLVIKDCPMAPDVCKNALARFHCR